MENINKMTDDKYDQQIKLDCQPRGKKVYRT